MAIVDIGGVGNDDGTLLELIGAYGVGVLLFLASPDAARCIALKLVRVAVLADPLVHHGVLSAVVHDALQRVSHLVSIAVIHRRIGQQVKLLLRMLFQQIPVLLECTLKLQLKIRKLGIMFLLLQFELSLELIILLSQNADLLTLDLDLQLHSLDIVPELLELDLVLLIRLLDLLL